MRYAYVRRAVKMSGDAEVTSSIALVIIIR